MSIETIYIVISADKKVRANRNPRLRDDEVAIRVRLKFPDNWGQVYQTIDADVPDFTPAFVDVVEDEAS